MEDMLLEYLNQNKIQYDCYSFDSNERLYIIYGFTYELNITFFEGQKEIEFHTTNKVEWDRQKEKEGHVYDMDKTEGNRTTRKSMKSIINLIEKWINK